MIRVWAGEEGAGVIDRLGERGSTFVYDPLASEKQTVSLTMPVRTQGWDTDFGLTPIFEMNLPEGVLRARLARQFAKAAGKFDELDLLGVVGRSQIGRLRYSGTQETLKDDVPFQSVDDILRARRDGGLIDYLLEQFAVHSGLSGVQAKVMIRDAEKLSAGKTRRSSSLRGATHIVKFWDEAEFPELAANEFFCLTAAQRLGLSVPPFQLSDDGGALVIERFDLEYGDYLGFEDFCVLNGVGAEDKYRGGYETRLFKRARQFVSPTRMQDALMSLFRLFVLNCAIRNGDAHLKNFGVTYASVDGEVELAPVYDLVTTQAYLANDSMALTLDGSSHWPDARALLRLGQTRADLSAPQVESVFEAVADTLADVTPDLLRRFKASKVPEIGERIAAAWKAGVSENLGRARGRQT